MIELRNKKAAVIGAGITGIATVRFLAGQGARIALTDEKPAPAWENSVADLKGQRGPLTVVPYGPAVLDGADLVVPSPGVYPGNPILKEALARSIPVLSELELAWQFLKTPVIAITGTNGKTTVTTLIGDILRAAGNRVFVGGNIGAPLIGYAGGPQEAQWAVTEVSSFQLQWRRDFRPAVALLLNTTHDHIDYHGSFAAYRQAKESIFSRQTAADTAILNADEPSTEALIGRLRAQVECFSSTTPVPRGMFLEGETLVRIARSGDREEYPLGMIRIPGRHNVENVMAAILAARVCGCSPPDIMGAVGDFRGIAHRIEYVGEVDGVRYYDDSKGTNVGAVVRALQSFAPPVVLLLGGRDKQGDFETLAPLIRERVRALICFGEARRTIDGLVGGLAPTRLTATMAEAVTAARALASPGDVVLLSPGCASFDEFTDYKARGKAFQALVRTFSR
ncbi:MAG: UDP-N-acetylmuramoyl-L-alanine--D-glutamate ligase [Thermodesulfobacteriota bacterium]